ncbi:MAG: hypothetical protein H6825_01620 [Planctomycetes bacterium]|nr:hypothetical protein [Planctomycetota bacterium]
MPRTTKLLAWVGGAFALGGMLALSALLLRAWMFPWVDEAFDHAVVTVENTTDVPLSAEISVRGEGWAIDSGLAGRVSIEPGESTRWVLVMALPGSGEFCVYWSHEDQHPHSSEWYPLEASRHVRLAVGGDGAWARAGSESFLGVPIEWDDL